MKIKSHFSAILGAMMFLWLASACQGRTAENMEPSGDTVEVNIDRQKGEEEDSEKDVLDKDMIHAMDSETILDTKI